MITTHAFVTFRALRITFATQFGRISHCDDRSGILARLPKLVALVQYTGASVSESCVKNAGDNVKVLTWPQFLEVGAQVRIPCCLLRLRSQLVNSVLTIGNFLAGRIAQRQARRAQGRPEARPLLLIDLHVRHDRSAEGRHDLP